jgi:hypothetical protein
MNQIAKFKQSALRFVLLGLLGLGLTTTLNFFQPAIASSKVPSSVAACFPKIPPVKSAKVSFKVQQEAKTYYLMSSDQSQGGSDLLISVDQNNRCSLLLFNPMGDTLPLSRFVPMSVAQQFALQQVKQGLAEAGSRTAYQQQILQVEVWTPEELWAVQQLGFKTPKNIKVIAPEEIKISPDQDSP